MADYTLAVKGTFQDEISSGVSKAEKSVSGMGKATEDAAGKTSGFGDVLKGVLASNVITSGISAITNGIKNMTGEMMNAGMNFEAQMDKVGAISGASVEDMEKLNDKAKEMGSSTKFTATEAGEAFEYMAMAGWKTEDMLGGVEGIMSLAAASGEDLGTASDIVTDALTAFGKTAADAGELADIMAAASSNANTNVSMMGETFKYAAPVAGALGFSMQDVAKATGIMANAGIKSTQAGTALRGWMTRMVKPTKEAKMAMEELGLSYANSDGSMKPLGQIIDEIRDKFSGLTEKQQGQYAAMLAGQNAVSGFLSVVNAAPEDLAKLDEAIANSSGSAAQMADQMQNNLAGQITIFGSAMEGLQLAIFEGLQTPLTEIVTFGAESVQNLTKGLEEDGIPGLFAAAGEVGRSFLDGIKSHMPEIVGTGFEIARDLLSGIVSGLPDMVIGAIEMADSFISGILAKLDDVSESGEFLNTEFIGKIISAADRLLEAGGNLVIHLVSGVVKLAPQLAVAGGKMLIDMIKQLAVHYPDYLKLGGNLILKLCEGIGQAAIDAGGVLLDWGLKWLDDMGVIDWLKAGKEIVLGIANGIKNAAGSVWDALYDAVSAAWDNALDWLGIASPSKRAEKEIGQNWALGIGPGFSKGMQTSEQEMIGSLNTTMAALTPDAITTGTAGNYNAATETTNARNINGGLHITINTAPGQNEKRIADQVMERIYREFETAYQYA